MKSPDFTSTWALPTKHNLLPKPDLYMSPNKNVENQSKETDTMNRDRAGLLPTVASPQPPEQLMEWRRRLLFFICEERI